MKSLKNFSKLFVMLQEEKDELNSSCQSLFWESQRILVIKNLTGLKRALNI